MPSDRRHGRHDIPQRLCRQSGDAQPDASAAQSCRARSPRSRRERHASLACLMHRGPPRIQDPLPALLALELDRGADVLVPLEAVVALAPAEHGVLLQAFRYRWAALPAGHALPDAEEAPRCGRIVARMGRQNRSPINTISTWPLLPRYGSDTAASFKAWRSPRFPTWPVCDQRLARRGGSTRIAAGARFPRKPRAQPGGAWRARIGSRRRKRTPSSARSRSRNSAARSCCASRRIGSRCRTSGRSSPCCERSRTPSWW